MKNIHYEQLENTWNQRNVFPFMFYTFCIVQDQSYQDINVSGKIKWCRNSKLERRHVLTGTIATMHDHYHIIYFYWKA